MRSLRRAIQIEVIFTFTFTGNLFSATYKTVSGAERNNIIILSTTTSSFDEELSAADFKLVGQQQRKLWNRPIMTPMVGRIVHCPPTADALLLVPSKVIRQHLIDK